MTRPPPRAARASRVAPRPAPPAGPTPDQRADWLRHASDRADAALTDGDLDTAARWLDRAARLAPDDPAIALRRAALALRRREPEAAARFATLAAAHDRRDVWVGLAAAHHRAGDARAAAAAASVALGRFAVSPEMARLAPAIATAAGHPGWCGLRGDGTLVVQAPTSPAVRLDGVPIRPRRRDGGLSLPPAWRSAARLEVTAAGTPLLGSPIALAALRRVEGRVWRTPHGVAGWAWHPADPDTDPLLAVDGRPVIADAPAPDQANTTLLAQPRGFTAAGRAARVTCGGVALPGLTASGAARRAPAVIVLHTGAAGPPASRPPGLPPHVPVIVIDDATPAAIAPRIPAPGRHRQPVIVRHPVALGEAACVAAALAAAPGRDVVLLADGVRLAAAWLPALRAAAYAAPDIGLAAPLCVPEPADLAALAPTLRANAGRRVDLPPAAAPCLYIRRDCLDALGIAGPITRESLARCARRAGWRSVGAAGVLAAAPAAAVPAAHAAAFAGLCRRLDAARWRLGRRSGAVVLITHDAGGGVARHVADRCDDLAARGLRPVVLRPAPGGCSVSEGMDSAHPGLRFRLPAEIAALARFLKHERCVHVELHHVLGHTHDVLSLAGQLGIPLHYTLHDYSGLCPRIALVDATGRYCGEPAVSACESCIATAGTHLEEPIGVAALRRRTAADLRAAARVVAPSVDAAARLRRHLPFVRPVVVPWETEPPRVPPPVALVPGRVCVIGALGTEKGFGVLLAAARDAAARDLDLHFVLVGHSIDDAALLATGRVWVTGPYASGEAVALIRAQNAAVALLPSIWPETWCYALTEAWLAGLHVVAFDLGAQAERIRARGDGTLIPPESPIARINDTLLELTRGVARRSALESPAVASRAA